MHNKLNVQSIFDSIDGEVNAFDGAGQLTTFIRLKGCNLHCQYCDTSYSQKAVPLNWIDVDEVMQQVHFKKVTITGGEPLLQLNEDFSLICHLVFNGHLVTIETNGSVVPIDEFFGASYALRLVVDYKTPSSGMVEMMNDSIFPRLRKEDVIKFVIANEEDYAFAKEILSGHHSWIAKIVFSPAITFTVNQGAGFYNTGEPDIKWPRQLAEKMIRDKIDAQFSLQIHKVLWPGAKEER